MARGLHVAIGFWGFFARNACNARPSDSRVVARGPVHAPLKRVVHRRQRVRPSGRPLQDRRPAPPPQRPPAGTSGKGAPRGGEFHPAPRATPAPSAALPSARPYGPRLRRTGWGRDATAFRAPGEQATGAPSGEASLGPRPHPPGITNAIARPAPRRVHGSTAWAQKSPRPFPARGFEGYVARFSSRWLRRPWAPREFRHRRATRS